MPIRRSLAGTYTVAQDEANCVDCLPGQADEDTDPNTPCTPCRAGKYADTAKATVCLACPPGTITDGVTACVACGPGQYVSAEGSSCIDCEAGRADTDFSASTPCASCQAGMYSVDTTSCESCAAGKRSNDAGTRCDDCFAGQVSAARAHACTHCEPGRAAPVGSSECGECPVGTFAWESAAECSMCEDGYEDADLDPTTLCTLAPLSSIAGHDDQATAEETDDMSVAATTVVLLAFGSAGLGAVVRGKMQTAGGENGDYLDDENENPLHEDENNNPIHEDQLHELGGMQTFDVEEPNRKTPEQPVFHNETTDDYHQADEIDNPLHEDEGNNPVHEDRLDELDSAMKVFDIEETAQT